MALDEYSDMTTEQLLQLEEALYDAEVEGQHSPRVEQARFQMSREASRPACRFDGTGEYSCGETPCILCHGPKRCTDNSEALCVGYCAAGCYVTGMGLQDVWRNR